MQIDVQELLGNPLAFDLSQVRTLRIPSLCTVQNASLLCIQMVVRVVDDCTVLECNTIITAVMIFSI
jgi:hypothetical protein